MALNCGIDFVSALSSPPFLLICPILFENTKNLQILYEFYHFVFTEIELLAIAKQKRYY